MVGVVTGITMHSAPDPPAAPNAADWCACLARAQRQIAVSPLTQGGVFDLRLLNTHVLLVVVPPCHRGFMEPAGERVTQRAEILLTMWKDHREQRRQHETQRSVMTNIIVLLSSGLVALVAQQGLRRTVLPAAIAVTVLGIYGYLVSLKYNERTRSDAARSHEFLERLDELDPELKLYDAHEHAQARKRKDFPISGRLNLSHIWIFLNIIIIAGGAAMTTACWRA